MDLSWLIIIALICLLLAVPILLGTIMGVIRLLGNERTRTTGFVVLTLGSGLLVLGGGVLFSIWISMGQGDFVALTPLVATGTLVLIGATVGITLLLANEKTRTAGFVVLTIGFSALICGGGLLLVLYNHSPLAYDYEPSAPTPVYPAESRVESSGSSVDRILLENPAEASSSPSDTPPEEDAPEMPEAGEPPEEGSSIIEPEPFPETNPRPEWVDGARTPRVVNALIIPEKDHKAPQSEKVYQVKATVGPYTSRMECDAHLAADLQEPVGQYVEMILGAEAARHVRLPDNYIMRHVVKEQWEEPVDASFGPMVQLHVLLQFDHKTRDIAAKQWHDYQVQERLWYAGGGLAAVLLVLAMAYSFLKGGWSMPSATVMLAVVGALGVVVVIAMLGWWISYDSPAPVKISPRQVDSVSPNFDDGAYRVDHENDGPYRVVDGKSVPVSRVPDGVQAKHSLFVGGPVLLLLVGGLALLISPKTRRYGFAVLGVLAVLMCVGVLFVA